MSEVEYRLPDAEGADLETLKLAYEEVWEQLRIQRDFRKQIAAELTATPTLAGAVLALFVALRPDDANALISVLYAIGVVPFLVIVVATIRGATDVIAPKQLAGVLQKAEIRGELEDADYFPLRKFLVLRIVGGRGVRDLTSQMEADYPAFLRRMRLLLVIELIYLVGVTVLIPFID